MRFRPVFLVGMMGVGKSTIGPLLAAKLGRRFIDTDAEIERAGGRRIPEIFEQEGEAAFRRLEAQVIAGAVAEPAVIALGGGALVAPGALERIRAEGEVVYLRASPELLCERIGDGSGRPLLAALDAAGRRARLEALLAERRATYERADHVVDAEGEATDVVDRILTALDLEVIR